MITQSFAHARGGLARRGGRFALMAVLLLTLLPWETMGQQVFVRRNTSGPQAAVIQEGAATLTFDVIVVGIPTGIVVEIDMQTIDGTTSTAFPATAPTAADLRIGSDYAVSGTDYTAVGTTTLSWNDQESGVIRTFQVNTLDDTTPEFNKDVFVRAVRMRLVSTTTTTILATGNPNTFIGIGHQGYTTLFAGGAFTALNGSGRAAARIAQNGLLVSSFVSAFPNPTTINAIASSAGGLVHMAGAFTNYSGHTTVGMVRFTNSTGNAAGIVNGGVDTNLAVAIQGQGAINAFAFYPATASTNSGKILIAGTFTNIGGVTVGGVARLSAAGVLDPSFDITAAGAGAAPDVRAVAIDATGNVFIGGANTSYAGTNGTATNILVKLGTNGAVDLTFDGGVAGGLTGVITGPTPAINALVLNAAGTRLTVGGDFTTYAGANVPDGLVQVNTTSGADSGQFPVGTTGTGAAGGAVRTLALNTGASLLYVGGAFTSFSGQANSAKLVRLFTTGGYDATFNLGSGGNNQVNTIAVETSGDIVVGGTFTQLGSNGVTRIARFISSVSPVLVDTNFTANGATANGAVNALLLNGTAQTFYFMPGIAAVTVVDDDQPGGALDRTWNLDNNFTTTPPNNILPGANNTVNGVAVDSSSRSVIVGDFTAFNSQSANRVARVTATGAFDTTFTPGLGADNFVSAVAIYAGGAHVGKIVLGGGFTSFNGSSRNSITRLNSNGTLDSTFNPAAGFNGTVRAVAIQTDDKVLAAGSFTAFNGSGRTNIARLNADGSLDGTFTSGLGPNGIVYAVAVDASTGKIYIGGDFTAYDGTARNRLARLNTDGTLDTGFDPGTGADAVVFVIVVQPDGKVLAAGNFTTIDQLTHRRLVRLTSSGAIDSTFNTGSGLDNYVSAIALAANGQPYIVGAFTSYNGSGRKNIARLFTDGSLDTTFMDSMFNWNQGPTNATSFLTSVGVQADGNVMIGGSFSGVGAPYSRTTGTSPGQTAAAALPSSNIDYDPSTGAMRWAHTKPRANLARLLGAGTPGPGNVQFESATYFVDESSGNASVRMNRNNGINAPVRVLFQTSNGSASAGGDYNAVSQNINWNSTGARQLKDAETGTLNGAFNTVAIVVIGNDASNEPDETVNMALTTLTATNGGFFNLGGIGVGSGNPVLVTNNIALGFQNTAVLTVADDDFLRGVLTFSATNYSALESAGTATITVIRTNGSAGVVTAVFFSGAGTATSGTDYTDVSGTLTFLAGETNKTFSVPILNDAGVELDETVNLTLTNATGGATIKLPGAASTQTDTAVLTITDDDFSAGRISFTASAYTVAEDGETVQIVVQRTGGAVGSASATFFTTNGPTAFSTNAFGGVTNALNWGNGDASTRTISITITNNLNVDGNRAFGVTVTNITGGLPGTFTNASVTITDDDAFGALSFSSASYAIAENGGNVIITVLRQNGSGGSVSVTNFTINGTATSGTHYTGITNRLDFAPGQTSTNFSVAITDDAGANANRRFTNVLTGVLGGATIGTPLITTVTIVDDESFNIPAGSIDTTFAPGAAANNFVQAMALQSDGKVIVGGDFTQFNNVTRNRIARLNTNGSLDTTFLTSFAGFNNTVRTITLQPDGRVLVGGSFTNANNTNRNYIVRLNVDGGTDSSFNPGSGADNPVYAIALYTNGVNSGKVIVGGGFATFNTVARNFLTRLNSDGSVDNTFTVGTGGNGTVYAAAIQTDGKVLIGGDFTTFNGTSKGNLLRLKADGSVDPTFNASGVGANGSVRVITLETDGKILIGGLFTNYNSTNVNFMARLNSDGSLDYPFTTNATAVINSVTNIAADNAVYAIVLQDDGKIVVGGDFSKFGGVTRNRITRLNNNGSVDPTINFGTGLNSFVAALLMQRSALNVEQIIVSGGFTTYNGTSANYLTRLNGGSLAGGGRLEFSAANYSITESNTNATITIVRTGGTAGTATNTFNTLDGTATNGLHYFTNFSTTVFPPGEVLQTVSVTVTNDSGVNSDRTVNLQIASITNNLGPGVLTLPGNQTNAVLTIVNDDALLGFSSATYSVNENAVSGFAIITVSRTGSTIGTATANYATTAGTATAGVDYTNASGALTFSAGEATKTFNVPVVNDSTVENNETILLTLSGISGAQAGLTNATLTIVEDDFAFGDLNFSAATYSANEAGGSTTITVVRSNGFSGVVSVNFATVAGGTAVAGVDYTSTNGTLAFADGQTSRTFTVPIIVNSGSSNNTTVNLQLSSPIGGATLGGLSTAVLNIQNNDVVFGNFNFTNTVYTVGESAGTVLLPVDRVGGSLSNVSVAVLVFSGTAVNGTNFSAASSNFLSWANGETNSKTVSITLSNDFVVAGDRSFTMTLTNAVVASVGITNTTTVNITDAQAAPGNFLFSATAYTVAENATNLQVTIIRTNGFTATNSFAITAASVTAGAVTLTTAAPHNLVPGSVISVAMSPADPNFDATNAVCTAGTAGTTINYTLGSATAAGGTGTVTEQVQITALTANGTAVHPDDYTGVTNTFLFADGQLSTNFLISISNNLIVAGNKIFTLTLTNATGGGFITNTNASVTIVDDDPTAGSVDSGFNPGTGPGAGVRALGLNGSGQLVIGGDFITFNGQGQTNVARLQASGALDTTFAVPPMANGAAAASVRTLSVQSDGKVIVGGQFTTIGGTSRVNLARLNTSGTLDTTFAPSGGANNIVNSVLALSSGRVLVGGAFTTIAGGSRNFIAQLLADGTLDTGFDPGSGANATVRAVAFDGARTLIGGDFTSVNGTSSAYLARLNSSGAVDGTFLVGTNLNGPVSAIRVQTDGKILIGGSFTAYGTTNRFYLARLNGDGSLDATFYSTGTELNNFVSSIDLQSDGAVVIGGGFTAFGSVSRNRFMRLTSGGALDPSINIGTGLNSFADAVLIQSDGRIALGGSFTQFNGTTAAFLARINGGINLGEGILGFSAPNYNVYENDGSVTITVLRTAGTSNTVSVAFATSDGTATNVFHYGHTNGTNTFLTGETLKTFVVPINEDTFGTNVNRIVNLQLSSISSPGGTASLGVSTATITIIDNDVIPNFSSATYIVSEAGGSVGIAVNRLGGPANAYSVQYATADGSALAGTHYVANTGTLNWADGDTAAKSFFIGVINNTATNGNLSLGLSLTNATNTTLGVNTPLSGQITATLTIVDDEFGPGQIGFLSAAYSVAENGGSVPITVIRTNGSAGPMSVDYATVTGGTATNLVHYTNTSGTFTWADGDSSSRTFTIFVNDDAITNAVRTVNLRLSNFAGGSAIGITNAVLSINDNDSLVGFSTNAFTVAENATNAVITILRSGATNTTVSVQFATANGAGATTPADYTGTNVAITFDPGMTATNLLVAITNDTLVETDGATNETVVLAISGPVTGAVVLNGALLATNGTLTILDDEIEFNFSAAGYLVSETNGTAVIDVIRTGVTNSTVLASVATVGGSNAVDGLDYFSTNATLVFGAGVTTQSLVITVLNNTVSNVTKATFVQLTNFPPGTQVGATNLVVLNILNDDDPAIAGSIDPSFSASLDGTVYALGINTNATPALIGKLVIAGDFTTVGGTSRPRIARLNRNGTLDTSFDPGTGANSSVRALAVQPDGGVVIGGFFSTVGGTPRNFIARVNANGVLDGTFNPGSGPNGQVNALVRQGDGKIIIGGQFTSVNGTNRGFLARLNADGSLDTTFDPGTGASATVRALALLADGSVIAGGDFQFVNGVSSRGLAKLSSSGAVDTVFAANLTNGVNGSVLSVAVYQGTLVIGGSFTDVVNGIARTNLARFTLAGLLDNTFTAAADGAVNTITAQADGKLLLGGGFNTVNGVARSHVARLAADGALDPAINFGTGADNDVTASLEQFHDGQLVLGGAFTTFAGAPASRLVRLSGGDNSGNGVLEFSASSYTVSESAQATITVIRSDGLTNTVTVTALTMDGTNGATAATSPADYLATTNILTFGQGVNQATFTVTNISDSEVEGNHELILVLTNVVNATLGSRSSATLTIADDDARLAFNVSVFNVSESGTNALITVVRTGGTNGTVTVDFATTAAGSATAGTDYTATNGTLTFADGVTSGSFNVRILSDSTVEPDETIVLALSNPGAVGQATAVLGPLSSATLNILNDDFAAGTLSLAASAFSVSESGANLVITVTRTNGTLGNVSVGYATANGTATAGPDYVAASGSLSWPDGDSTTRSFTVTINDDGAVEGNETFNLSLSGVTGGAGLNISNAVVTIFDDDGVVQFSAANYSVSESVTNATIAVVRTGGTNNVVTFTYATTASGSATPGVDFTSTNGLLTFTNGVTNLSFDVPVINDQLAEANETIGLALAYQSGVAFLGSLSNATITIVDNDIAVQFASATFSVQENSPNATITVVRSGATNSSVSVNFATSDGTAVNGQDYTSQIGTLTFAAGETSKTFSITILDDAVVESDETVNLSLSLPTGGATLGTPSTATLTIVNNDTGVEFTTAVYSVAENLTNALISVRRIGVTNTAFTVNFATSDNTAVAGVNYTNTNGVMSFASGVVSNAFQVGLIDNGTPQGDKLVNLLLSNPSGTAVLGPQAAATLNIADNEVTLQFSASSYNVLEDQTNALISVTRLGSGGAVTVNYAATAGSASTNDFSLVSGTLSFGTGVTNLAFAVPLVNDILSEANETVNLALSAPGGGAALGTPSTATLRIVDNDRVGSLDSQFLTATGAASDVQAVAFYSNPASTNFGKVIIAGDFQTVDGTNRVRLARLLSDGTLDPSFNPGLGADNVVYCAAIQTDDQIVIGGGFTSVGGLTRNYLTRLNSDGSVDTNYNTGGAGADGAVLALALQPDGKAVIGGAFTAYNGTARARLARLNTNGTLDTVFAPAGAGASDLVYAVALDATSNVVVGGLFTSFAGSARSQLARVNTNGVLDTTFTPSLNAGAQVYALAVQSDGKVLAAGSFTISAFSRTNIVRLAAADGAVDPTFSAAAFANSTVRALALESAGNVLIGGDFTALNGSARGGFGRLNTNGTLDTTYDPGTGANGSVFAIATQPDGKAIIGGRFTTEDGVSRGNVARINGDHGALFALGSATVLERGTNVTLSVTRFAGASGTITVDYATTNGTAVAGADYVAASGTLTFAPGVTNQSIVVTILNDTVVEADENFIVFLTNIQGGLFGSPTNCLVTIENDDSTLQFTVAATNIFEDATSVILTVDRVGSTNTTVTLPFNTLDGAALHGSDYTGVTNTLTFDTNVISQNIIIPILNDQLEETNKVFNVVLGTPGGEASLGTNTNVVVTIVDNDSTLFLATNAATVFENDGTVVLTVNRTGFTNNAVAAAFTTSNGTAVAVADYTATSGTLNFATGTVSLTITVPLVNDQLEEATEAFNVSLTNVTGEASFGPVTNATVTILDNDSTLFLTTNAATVVESVGSVSFTVARTGFTNDTVTVPFSTLAGSALAGTDYTLTTNVLTFGTNIISANIVVPIVNDTTVESTEAFTLQLYPAGGEASLATTNTAATITITDDDSTLEFSVAAVSVTESAGSVTLTVLRAGTSNSTVAVNFATTNGTALAGQDYVASSGTLTFGTNVISRTISVTVNNDTVVEADESFSVLLSSVAGEASLGVNSNTIVTILNDDSTLQFTAAGYSVIERVGSVTLTVSRVGASNSTVSVPFASANVTAFAGADYTATSGTLTFGTNVLSTNIVVTILNDKLSEANETFNLVLGTPGGEASLGTPSTAVVTIQDDESTLEFASTNVTSVLESGGSISLVVSRVGVIDTAVTVPFSFGDVSAVNGVDYLGTNGTLAFGTNVAAQVVTVGILNDLLVESNKTFTITLGTPAGEALLGAGRVATVTVLDDDSLLQFPFGQLNVAESAGNLTVTVQRVGATNVTVAVDLATGDGLTRTATANVDYSTVVTNLVFASGVDARSITIFLTNDFTEEGTESFRVQLNNATGQATLGSQTNLTVNIIDDDFRTLIAAGATLVAESFAPTNNAVDPLESVTMLLALRNAGNVNASNITATLLATGGVLNPGGPQVYTNLAAGGASLAMPFTFTATQAQTIVATLQLSDANGTLGSANFTVDLGVANSYSNRSLINLPGTLSVPSFGTASPYPSSITVSNVAGVVNKVTVRLNGFTHSYPADVDVLLVSPTGQKVVLMSDAGSSFSTTNLTLTFEDSATASLPELSPLASGTFKPTDYAPADTFASPAPAGPYATNLAAFSGFSPNGTWSLYIVDDTDQNFGNIVNGWTLNFNTVNAAIDLGATMTNAPSAVTAPGTVTFTTVITNRGPNIATGVVYSNALPAGLAFVSATTSAGTVTSAGSNVVVNLGTLGLGSNHIVSVTVSTSGSGLVTNTATVASAGEIELALPDNTASATVTIAPAVPFSLFGARQTNGQFFITVSNAVVGRTYVVEAATNFVNPVTNTLWVPVATNVASGSTVNVTDTAASGLGRRFYRAIER